MAFVGYSVQLLIKTYAFEFELERAPWKWPSGKPCDLSSCSSLFFLLPIIKELIKTRGPLGHILDAGIRGFGAVSKGRNKVEQPRKGTHFQSQKIFTNIEKHFSIEKRSVLHIHLPLDHFYEPHHGLLWWATLY